MNVTINSESNETHQQVVSFSDQNQQWMYSVDNRLDSAHHTVDSDDASLSNFFSRPVKIASLNWSVGGTLGTTINPWQLYFENPRVINRISNYNVLRSKLCVRIMINGNGFHYGRALASYRPLHNEDDLISWRLNLVPQDIIGASQRMHVWLDPTKSQGGTLCLPFVWYKNGLSIPEAEWISMGELDIGSVTTLQHANGGTDSVTVSVFAWAEDVSISVPTSAEPASLVPQAGEYDEASKGIISGPANTVASIARALTVVPQIRPLALATEMASGAIGNIAKLFGMSRPVDAGPISSYKPSYTGNSANTNVMDTSTKLTFDVKQELTIDPVAVGLGPADEMAISSIASRESYLTQFPWATTAAPDTLLWNSWVTPSMFDTASGGEFHYTPVGFVSRPFENWRGSINFRFQIVASAFHKGRLKIVYDPAKNFTSETNVQYTHVIDLAKERDFTVNVAWGQERSFLDHTDFATLPPFSTSTLIGDRHGIANGVLAVYVVNDLTTPSLELSDVSILVSVSAGDDFEVVNPNAANISNVSFFQPQAGEFEPQAGDLSSADEDLTTEETKPLDTTLERTFAIKSTPADAYRIFYGDPVSSVRQILKRYVRHRTHAWIVANGASEYVLVQASNFPVYRGYTSQGEHNAAVPVDPTPFNYVYTTPLNWFTPAFLCRRGGLRMKYIYANVSGTIQGIMSVDRITENGSSIITPQAIAMRDATSNSTNALSSLPLSLVDFSGGHVTPVANNPVLEVELPFAAIQRFYPGRKLGLRSSGSGFTQQHYLQYPNAGVGSAFVHALVSTGEDFSLAFFQAVPVFWEQSSPTPSPTS